MYIINSEREIMRIRGKVSLIISDLTVQYGLVNGSPDLLFCADNSSYGEDLCVLGKIDVIEYVVGATTEDGKTLHTSYEYNGNVYDSVAELLEEVMK